MPGCTRPPRGVPLGPRAVLAVHQEPATGGAVRLAEVDS